MFEIINWRQFIFFLQLFPRVVVTIFSAAKRKMASSTFFSSPEWLFFDITLVFPIRDRKYGPY